MKNSALLAVGLVLVVMALAACNPIKTFQKRERLTQLNSVVNIYRKLMRWGHYDQAAQYLKARDDSPMLPDFKAMSRYKVSSYTIADQIFSDTDFEAKITAYVDFYNIDTGVALSLRDEQFWWYDEQEKRWNLGSPMMNFSSVSN